jgi:uncharacterized membrane protein
MPMRTHELHPTLIHAPLVLLPAAVTAELLAATSRRRIRRMVLDRAARTLWWGAAGTGLAAGLAGMAAARQVHVPDRRAQDAMFVHGIGNLGLVLAAFGIAAWRSRHRASLPTAILGGAAVDAALYTAWLGGGLVYGHGVGVKAMPGAAEDASPPLFSAQAPGRLVKDAIGGLGWLLQRAVDLARGRDRLQLREIAPGSDGVSEPRGTRQPEQPSLPLH